MFSADHLHRRVRQTLSLFDFLNGISILGGVNTYLGFSQIRPLLADGRRRIHANTQKAPYIEGKIMGIVNSVPAANSNQTGQREGWHLQDPKPTHYGILGLWRPTIHTANG